jgi:HD domain
MSAGAYRDCMGEILALLAGPLASAALSRAQQTESAPVADRSIRSLLFARLLAHRDGSVTDAAYDEDLLFAACIMHDLGLGTSAPGNERFEVEGADLAAGLLRQHDVATADIDRISEAIALHASIGIAHRRGLLTFLTHKGVLTDAGQFTDLEEGLGQQVVAAYPQPTGGTYIQDAIVAHAKRSPTTAPPYSIGAELVREELTP